jgi:tellurite resistance protein TerC
LSRRVRERDHLQITYRWARRIAIAVVGGTVLLLGVAMIVLPGPAIVVIPTGLAILGLEFAWARRWLRAVRARTGHLADRINGALGRPARDRQDGTRDEA